MPNPRDAGHIAFPLIDATAADSHIVKGSLHDDCVVPIDRSGPINYGIFTCIVVAGFARGRERRHSSTPQPNRAVDTTPATRVRSR
jgi:hypothetical protein